MNITVEKIKRTLEKDYGWENLRSEENFRYVEHLLSDTLKVINNEANDLENYFKNTPREKVLDDWEKSKEFDSVNSHLMSEYIDIIEKLQTTNLIKNKNQNK